MKVDIEKRIKSTDIDKASENVRCLAYQAVEKWILTFNRSYVQVSLKQKENILLLIKNLNEVLSDSIIRELLFVLK